MKTTVTGDGPITNVVTTDVAGRTLTAGAAYTPGAAAANRPTSGFAFTSANAQRIGLLGLLGVLGGWFLVIAARRRQEDEVVIRS